MESFSELLSGYVQRVGVSDTELARRLGVSRQTVFRWREGLTRRPRRREDVLEIASRLRLSPAERDALLLSAGFPPESPAPTVSASPAESGPNAAQATGPRTVQLPARSGPAASPAAAPATAPIRPRWLAAALLAALLGLGTFLALRREELAGWLEAGAGERGAPASVSKAPGSTLVLVSQFANYSGEQVGYNIAGRLQEALEAEFRAAGLTEVQVAAAEQSARDEQAARELGARWEASLVVWGEYDSGRVIARVTAPEVAAQAQRRWLVLSPEQLSATINTDLAQEVGWMTLYVLGRVHFLARRLDPAAAALERALAAPPADPAALAAVYYYLGLVESLQPQVDLNEVIAYYSEALARQPDQTAALNNRGVAYLERRASGDLERAEADLRRALFYNPDDPVPQFNLALTLARQGPSELSEALGLLRRAEQAEPDSAGVQNALCWFLSLSGSPEQALPHCDAAVALDESGNSNDSRGLTLALLGRSQEAAAEFKTFLERLEDTDPQGYARYAPSRQEWIEALERGENPFDEASLQLLLQE
jgi:tetratricopeptide (TPR) repeat protein/transcriptional regulator with XRE-family HTH domain